MPGRLARVNSNKSAQKVALQSRRSSRSTQGQAGPNKKRELATMIVIRRWKGERKRAVRPPQIDRKRKYLSCQ